MLKKIGAVGKIGIAVFVVWLVLKFGFGKSGFVHILLLFAISSAVLQIVHDLRAWQK